MGPHAGEIAYHYYCDKHAGPHAVGSAWDVLDITPLRKGLPTIGLKAERKAMLARLEQNEEWGSMLARLPEEKAENDTIDSIVYFIRQRYSNYYKVGYTTNIRQRLAQYSTHSAEHIDLIGQMVGTLETESDMRAYVKQIGGTHTNGEWYELSPEQAEKVRSRFTGAKVTYVGD